MLHRPSLQVAGPASGPHHHMSKSIDIIQAVHHRPSTAEAAGGVAAPSPQLYHPVATCVGSAPARQRPPMHARCAFERRCALRILRLLCQ